MLEQPEKFFSLDDAVENLIAQIQQHESDTFSASHSGVGRDTAKHMAAWLIRTQFFDQDGFPRDTINSGVLECALDNVTEWIESEHDAMTATQEAEVAALWDNS